MAETSNEKEAQGMIGSSLLTRKLMPSLVAEVRALAGAKLPDEVLEVARHCVVDWLGCVIAGSQEPLVVKLRHEVREKGGHPLRIRAQH